MNKQRLLLGVDGGGSQTQVWLAELSGDDSAVQLIGSARGGPANVRVLGLERAMESVQTTVRAAFAVAGRVPSQVEAACVSLAGAGRPAEQLPLQAALEKTLARRVMAVGDCEILLAATGQLGSMADPQEPGLALVAGTGSIAWGRNLAGQTARSGGWGHLLGDEGSGFALAQAALRLACATADGQSHEHAWLAAVVEHLQLERPADLIAWCYADPSQAKSRIASLCPLLFQHQAQSVHLQHLIAEGAQALAQLVTSTADKLGLDASAVDLVCGGSLLCQQPSYRLALRKELTASDCEVQSITCVDQPVAGAVRLAHTLAAR